MAKHSPFLSRSSGATVNVEDRDSAVAISAVLDDASVAAVAALQDTQESLNPATLQNYMGMLNIYAESGRKAQKPFLVISPTSENVDPGVRALLAENGVPLLRGLTPGLCAMGTLASGKPRPASRRTRPVACWRRRSWRGYSAATVT